VFVPLTLPVPKKLLFPKLVTVAVEAALLPVAPEAIEELLFGLLALLEFEFEPLLLPSLLLLLEAV
jgi:hypothetical protein